MKKKVKKSMTPLYTANRQRIKKNSSVTYRFRTRTFQNAEWKKGK